VGLISTNRPNYFTVLFFIFGTFFNYADISCDLVGSREITQTIVNLYFLAYPVVCSSIYRCDQRTGLIIFL